MIHEALITEDSKPSVAGGRKNFEEEEGEAHTLWSSRVRQYNEAKQFLLTIGKDYTEICIKLDAGEGGYVEKAIEKIEEWKKNRFMSERGGLNDLAQCLYSRAHAIWTSLARSVSNDASHYRNHYKWVPPRLANSEPGPVP